MTALLAVVALVASVVVVIRSMQHPATTVRFTPVGSRPAREPHPRRIEPPAPVDGPILVRARPLLGQFGAVEPDLAPAPSRRIAAAGGLVLTTLVLAAAAAASIYIGLLAVG